MGIASKGWDWAVADKKTFLQPCEESYYIVERWKKKGFNKVLDLGSGRGRHSIQLSKAGFEVSAVEISESGVEYLKSWSKEELLQINTLVGDMLKIPFEDNSFDAVFSYNVISHTDTEGLKTVVSEIKRVLRDGGEFFVTICSKNDRKFTSDLFPKVDENTRLFAEEGPEYNVPHCCVDEKLIRELFGEFDLNKIRQVQDYYMHDGKVYDSWHYVVIGEL